MLPESFSLSSVSNGIALCPTCHVNFDTYEDPGLVIVPSNLEFFVQYEIADYKKREESARCGITELRTTPTASDYQKYQVQEGAIDRSANAGLFKPIVLVPWRI
jgi:hypothetical protein